MAGVGHDVLHFLAESPAFIDYFFTGFVLKTDYDFGEFERRKQTVIIFCLPVDDFIGVRFKN